MNFTGKQQGDLLPEKITDYRQFDAILSKHREMKKMMKENEKNYFDEEKDQEAVEQYYCGIDFKDDQVIEFLKKLLKETHTNQVRYKPTEYVYPWVDLYRMETLRVFIPGKSETRKMS
ncbi:hypothetical protein [Oceanobacillus zhaokaii]|uniref:hypothetical protein n=1 Tax=Oceanobacillus zhaokaii TaxID=2052660 RepID=UPI001FA84A8E|nr:hypothetical protein [Oceanobacillus zhaokaii]